MSAEGLRCASRPFTRIFFPVRRGVHVAPSLGACRLRESLETAEENGARRNSGGERNTHHSHIAAHYVRIENMKDYESIFMSYGARKAVWGAAIPAHDLVRPLSQQKVTTKRKRQNASDCRDDPREPRRGGPRRVLHHGDGPMDTEHPASTRPEDVEIPPDLVDLHMRQLI